MSDQTIRLAICAAGELYGGIEQFVRTFTEYLCDNTNTELVVVLFYDGKLARELRSAGIDVVTVIPRWKYDVTVLWRLMKEFKTRCITVVHTHGYLATILGAISGKLVGTKVVKTEHGIVETHMLRGLEWSRLYASQVVDRSVTRLLVDHVVYVTDDLRRMCHRRRRTGRYPVIYNGIPPVSVDTDRSAGPDIDRSMFNIGMVGRLSAVKGHIDLLRALLQVRRRENVRVYFFGTGSLEETLRDFCNEHGLTRSVHFMGFRVDVLDWLARLDAFVMPSLHEGLPYALIEAMYLGVPVIASRVGGLAEVLEHGVDAILVEQGSKKQLAAAIDRLMAGPDLCESLAANARKKAEGRFMIQRMASEYLSLYASVCRDS